jgi:predicted transcriptional regulator YheO
MSSAPRTRGRNPHTQAKKRTPARKEAGFTIARQVSTALHELLGGMCEVVVHDFSDLEHSIVHIDGDISKRTVGGAATDLILNCVQNGTTASDLYGYNTTLPGGRLMKSSTVFLRDARGKAIGALCINLDVTDFIAFRNTLNVFAGAHTDSHERPTETLSDNILETVQNVLAEALYDSGRSLHTLTREDKVELMKHLESRGLFQVKKAVPIVADLLGLSRATVYNYLREGRDTRKRANAQPHTLNGHKS